MARAMTLAGSVVAAVAALSLSLPVLATTTPKVAQLSAKVVAPTQQQQRPASPNVVSSHVLSLEKVSRPKVSSSYLKALAGGPGADAKFSLDGRGYGATHIDDLYDYEFVATIDWGETPVKVIVDSGSSDTWLVQSGFQCLNVNGTNLPEANCTFGPTFDGTFQHGTIPNENFNISYGDGEFISGDFGYTDVTVAGIDVRKQQVALVNRAYWNGDGVTSGLMGLAYPLLTSAFKGDDPTKDSLDTQIIYDSIFTTMIKEKLVDPVFSLACERNSSGGYLALGGLPPIDVEPFFGSTPIQKLEIYNESAMLTHYSFYTIVADAYIYKGSDNWSGIGSGSWWNSLFNWPQINTTQFPIIVDSGTTLLMLPTQMMNDIFRLFDPAPVFIPSQGSYFAPCGGSVPKVSVVIGGLPFSISAADLLVQGQTLPNDTNSCLVGISDGGEGPYILGDTFLNNVLAVFDVGASEMRFAQHYY